VIRKISRDNCLPENFDKREQWHPFVGETGFFRPLRSFAEFFNIDKDTASTTDTATENFNKADEDGVTLPSHLS